LRVADPCDGQGEHHCGEEDSVMESRL
jgi:hypothetical protein